MEKFKKIWIITALIETIIIIALTITTIIFAGKANKLLNDSAKENQNTVTLFVAMETSPGNAKIKVNGVEKLAVDLDNDDKEISACPGDVVSLLVTSSAREIKIYTYTNNINEKTKIYCSCEDANNDGTMGNISSYEFVVANLNYYIEFLPTRN